MKAAIKGIGAYAPEEKLTNKDLEKLVETNDEWIVSRTGIQERRILRDPEKAASYMGVQASKEVLERTQTPPEAVDLIICATATPDYLFPSTANLIANELGAKNSFGFDLLAACSSFLFAVDVARRYVESGGAQNVLVVGSDKMSSIVDYTDRATCILFGDAAGAVLVGPDETHGIEDSILYADGKGEPFLHQKAGGSRNPATHETVDAHHHYVYQEGSTVFKMAVTSMAEVSEEIMLRNGLKAADVAFLAPHQANKRIIDATAKRMNLDPEKVLINIDRFGNTTNATIPTVLHENEHRIKRGDNIIMAAFGGGFTWGATYLTWAY